MYIYTLYHIILHIHIYIYICSFFLPQIFPRPAVQKNKHIFSFFPQPALPSQPKKNKHTFCSFFVTDLPAASPPKNISLKKTQHIYLFQFFPLIFLPPALKKI